MAYLAAAQAALGIAGGIGSTISKIRAKDLEAKGLDIAARSELDQAAFDERQQRRVGQFFMGERIASAAASGVDVSQGSPLFAALDQAKQNELQALSIRRAGKVRYNRLKFDSLMKKSEIEGDIISGIFGGANQGAQGAGSILSAMGSR